MQISVPNVNDLYIAQLDREFQGSAGFNPSNYTAAANFLLQQNYNLPKALEYVDMGMNYPFFGRTDFGSLSTKAQILLKMNKGDEAMAAMEAAIDMPGSSPGQIHQLGRSLIGIGKKEEALKIFKLNYEKFNGAWPTNVGMARGLSAVGQYEEAIKYAKAGLAEAPDQINKDSLASMIEKLKTNKDVN
jgi:tetratricopeptide (TPR) repeat protein